jgi:O-antigen/teichoic acid export membrane protein
MPIFFVMVMMPVEFMHAVFGNEYTIGATVLVFLSIAQFVNVGTGPVGNLLVMTGNQKIWFKISLTAFLLSIICNIIFIPRYGIEGAAVSTLISISILFLLGLIAVKKYLHIWPYDWRYYKGAIAGVAAIFALVLVNLMNIQGVEIKLVFAVIISFGVFGGVLYFIGLDKEDVQVIEFIKGRFLKIQDSNNDIKINEQSYEE